MRTMQQGRFGRQHGLHFTGAVPSWRQNKDGGSAVLRHLIAGCSARYSAVFMSGFKPRWQRTLRFLSAEMTAVMTGPDVGHASG